MRISLLRLLVCPTCGHELELKTSSDIVDGQVQEGHLECLACRCSFPIVRGIPRFVEFHPADSSFGFQWNQFRKEQLDSANGARLSAQRLWAETGWPADQAPERRVLEVGCGAGRFLEVMADTRCHLVGVDVSSAIDAAAETVRGKPNVDLVQADVYHLPFREGVFDLCYCIGVAQHTPHPQKTLAMLPKVVKPGGRLAVTVYERRPWTRLNGKYLLRPITRRMSKKALYRVIQGAMPVLFPLTEVLFRLPLAGRAFDFVIPVANYTNMRDLTWSQRYQVALLDTFDRLAPDFDGPLTEAEVREALATAGMIELERLPNPGVNIVGTRSGASQ